MTESRIFATRKVSSFHTQRINYASPASISEQIKRPACRPCIKFPRIRAGTKTLTNRGTLIVHVHDSSHAYLLHPKYCLKGQLQVFFVLNGEFAVFKCRCRKCLLNILTNIYSMYIIYFTSKWWFQLIWESGSQNGSCPQVGPGANTKNIGFASEGLYLGLPY